MEGNRTSTPSLRLTPWGRRLACGAWLVFLAPLAHVQAARRARANSKSAASDPWQFLGPNGNGDYGQPGILTRWPASGPRVLWRTKVGEGYSSLACNGKRLVGLFMEGGQEVIRCFDTATGRELWRWAYDGAYKNKFGNGPRSTPLIDASGARDPLVYTLGARGHLHCVRLSSGRVVWKTNILRQFGAKNLRWGVSTSPLIEGKLLIINAGGRNASIVAFDKRTGAVVWKSLSDTAGYATPRPIGTGRSRQILVFTEPGLVSVSPTTGRLLWRHEWKTSYGVNAPTPIIAGDLVFVTSGYGKGCTLLKVGPSGARAVWTNRVMASHFSTPVLHEGHLYGFAGQTGGGKLKCLELTLGDEKWSKGGFKHGQVILADGHLIILGERGQLALAEATPAGYREKGRAQVLTGKCWTVPVLAGGRLFVRNEKELVALDVAARRR